MRNEWLSRRLKDMGKTGIGLARSLGVDKARVSEIIGGRRGVRAEEVPVIAHYLHMSESEVIACLAGRAGPLAGSDDVPPPRALPAGEGGAPMGEAPAGAFGFNAARLPPTAAMPLDVPVFGTAVGGVDGDFEMNGEVIDRVRRPPGLTNARNAFALYVVGTSMSPRYDEGDLIFLHPGRPPVPGCDVVVELHAQDEFGRHKALLKTYGGKTPTRLLLSQLNPAGPVEIPLDQVRQVLRVLRTNELLGV